MTFSELQCHSGLCERQSDFVARVFNVKLIGFESELPLLRCVTLANHLSSVNFNFLGYIIATVGI